MVYDIYWRVAFIFRRNDLHFSATKQTIHSVQERLHDNVAILDNSIFFFIFVQSFYTYMTCRWNIIIHMTLFTMMMIAMIFAWVLRIVWFDICIRSKKKKLFIHVLINFFVEQIFRKQPLRILRMISYEPSVASAYIFEAFLDFRLLASIISVTANQHQR